MLQQRLIKGWHTHTYCAFALLLMVLSSLMIVCYYVNYPYVDLNADTPAYLDVVQHIQMRMGLVNTWRLPGYPLFITGVYIFAGQHNLMAVSIVQAVVFVLATLEVYMLALLLWHRAWLAFLVGLLVGPNLVLLSYIKPIMSCAISLRLLVTMRCPRGALPVVSLCVIPLSSCINLFRSFSLHSWSIMMQTALLFLDLWIPRYTS